MLAAYFSLEYHKMAHYCSIPVNVLGAAGTEGPYTNLYVRGSSARDLGPSFLLPQAHGSTTLGKPTVSL